MAKWKVDFENWRFQNWRKAEYLFTDIAGKPVYLVCGADLTVIKEYKTALRDKTSGQVQKHEWRTEATEVRVKEESDITANFFHQNVHFSHGQIQVPFKVNFQAFPVL